MRTYTVTEKYRAVNEGKMAKSEFLRQMRLGYPEHITQWNGFKDTVQILKNRGLLFEEAKPVVKEEKIDAMKLPYSLEALDRGIRHEFAEAKIEYHAGANINMEQYNDALNKAKANLDKDPMHYLNILAGNDKNVDKNDKMRPVSDKPDVFNGLKKADLREAKTMLKEGKMDDLAEKLGIDVGRLQAAADRLREMEREDAAKTAGKVNAMKAIIDEEPDEVMNIDRLGREKEDHDSNYTKVKDKDTNEAEGHMVDEHEHMFFSLLFNKKYDDILDDYMSSDQFKGDEIELQGKTGQSNVFDAAYMDEWEDAIKQFEANNYDYNEGIEDVIDPADYGEIAQNYLDGFDKPHSLDLDQLEMLGRKIVKSLYKGDFKAAMARHGGKNVNEEPQQEIDTSAAKASLAAFAAREKELDRQNPNRHKEAGAKASAERDAARAAKKKGGNSTAKFTSFYNKEGVAEKKGTDHDKDGDIDGDDYKAAKDKAIKKAMGKDDEKNEQLKEAIKKIIKKSLNKDTLNEAATNHLAAMADTYGDYKGMTVVLNDLQNIVTDIESYYAKQKDRLEGVFKKVGEIQNEEGFKVGGFLAPAIESAFVKDSRHLGGSRFMKGVEIPKVKVAKFNNLRQEEAPIEAEAAPKETIFGINEKGEFKLRKDL